VTQRVRRTLLAAVAIAASAPPVTARGQAVAVGGGQDNTAAFPAAEPAAAPDPLAALRGELETLRAQLAATRAELDGVRGDAETGVLAVRAELEPMGQDVQDLDQRIIELSEHSSAQSSAIDFLLAGTAVGAFATGADGRPAYSAALSPHFLWSFHDRALFEAHIDLKTSGDGTSVGVEFAQVWLPIGDHLAVGAGKIIAPFGFYMDAIHTAWINRLPDEPLPVADGVGLAPTHMFGAQIRAVTTLGRPGTRLVGILYGGSAPALALAPADGEEPGEGTPGALDHDRAGRGAAGGRIAASPVAGLELGASGHVARVDPDGAPMDLGEVHAWTGGADASYTDVVAAMAGTASVHGEWVISRIDQHGGAGSPYDRTRQGLYLQLAYGPSEVDTGWLRRLEGVTRYERLDRAGLAADRPGHVDRFTWGIDYWLYASLVGKVAYQVALTDGPTSSTEHRVLAQVAAGF
jgi:hypothetical protein